MRKRKPVPPFQAYREWKESVDATGIYTPFMTTHEVSLHSNKYRAVSPKTNNQIAHLFSGGEYHAFLMLDWNDNVSKIYSQYPLDINVTYALSESLKIRHPSHAGRLTVMTTDLVAKLHQEVDGSKLWAIQVKREKEKLTPRDKEKICLEQACWQSLGMLFTVVYSADFPQLMIDNLMLLSVYRRQKYPQAFLERAMAVYNELRSKCDPAMCWPEFEQCSKDTLAQTGLSCHELLLCLTATKKITFPIVLKAFSAGTLEDFAPVAEEAW